MFTRVCENKSARQSLALISTLVAFSASAPSSLAQGDLYGPAEEERETSFTVTMNQDSFFGFYPAFNGLVPVSDTMDFSFYGILWTKPAFGLGQGNSGDDLWTEFGVGVNLHLMDGNLLVKPQLGITNGSLLSGGVFEDGETGASTGANFADGIVPSLTINYSDDQFEAEWYSGYYAALRNRGDDRALDFLHLWANAGYKFTSIVSGGVHYEILDNSRNNAPGASGSTAYQWLGGYVQFALPKGFFARLTGGADIQSGGSGDFYKLNVGMSF
ncbi:MAG: DUF6733 family protein [Pseudomonadota bacterium]